MICLEIIKALSIIVASIVAIFGINSWRRELRGKRKMEIAEDALALFYQAKDAITDMRFPGGYGHEGKSREPEDGESDSEKRAKDNAYVMIERYQPYKDVFAKLHSIRYQFMALFGKQSGEEFEKIRKLHNRLFLSANRLARLWAIGDKEIITEKENEINWKRIQKEEAIFWDNGDDDEINKELRLIIAEIEKICMPILTGYKKFNPIA